MDLSAIGQLISNYGFPIVACCYMAYTNHQQTIRHQTEMSAVTEALHKLETSITLLNQRIGGGEDEL